MAKSRAAVAAARAGALRPIAGVAASRAISSAAAKTPSVVPARWKKKRWSASATRIVARTIFWAKLKRRARSGVAAGAGAVISMAA
jgi:hypothetical protein